jgi:Cu-Zn family superoxide dismutase
MLCAGLMLSLGAAPAAFAKGAKPIKVTMNKVTADGVGESIGTVTIKESKDGLTLEPNLHGLTPGEHGFHVHEKPSCDPADKDGKKTAAQAAGGHYDPEGTKAHKGPGGGGHKGDLPKLVVSEKGEAKDKLDVKGLTLADVQGKALMIHAGGDNYSDTPKPLGGGGERFACGVVK